MPTSITVPYELLVRWREGVFSGAHVGWSLLVTEDDGTKREIPQGVEPVDVGLGKGFPLADILDKVSADGLVKIAEHEATIADKDATIEMVAIDKVAELAVKDVEIATAAAAHAAEKAAKDAVIATKAAEIAAENAVAVAAKGLAAKIAEVAEVEKDDPTRAAKEAEAAQLAAQVAARDAELAFIKLPEKEQRDQKIRDEIARLEDQLEEGK